MSFSHRSIPIISLLLAALVAAGPATAGTEAQPEITDPAGDANGINGQGFLSGAEEGPDTRPASSSSVDLRAAWFETRYLEIVDREGGDPARVRHVPTGLRVVIQTEGHIGSFGPTTVFRVPATVGACDLFFQGWVRGPSSAPTDTPQRADIRLLNADCPGGARTITGVGDGINGFQLRLIGNRAVLDFPYPALDAASAKGLLAPGVEIGEVSAHVRPLLGAATVPQFDETAPGEPFVVGSDIPADVDCSTGTHSLCG